MLRRIFFDDNQHWEAFKAKNGAKIRPVVIKEVEKYRDCGDLKKGFKLLVCEGCHDLKTIPYRCKGRFCPACAKGETEEWSRLLEQDVFQVNHRHVILTIDKGLREIFIRHRELLKVFMDEGVKLVKAYFEKKHHITPGIIAGLHTFGSRLNFNPHLHMLVTMGGMQTNGEWKTYDFIPFEMLRKQWQTVVLKLIRKQLSKGELKKVQPLLQKAYQANGEGFYIYAPKRKGDVRVLIGYIGRYIRRPAIAESRIEAYDGQYVTFRYYDKKDEVEKQEKITVEEFIARIIRHIPDEQFKMIRHYGVYSRRTKGWSKKLVGTWQKQARKWIVKAQTILRRRTWNEKLKEKTGKDVMVCPMCECYYEYKGEVCLKEGQLVVKRAVCKTSQRVLERMINDLTGIQEKKNREEKETSAAKPEHLPSIERGRQLCVSEVLGERRDSA